MGLHAVDPGSAEAHRVLVVDDEPDLLEVVRMTLEAGGYDVACAGSSKEALAIVEKNASMFIAYAKKSNHLRVHQGTCAPFAVWATPSVATTVRKTPSSSRAARSGDDQWGADT